jgi:hypothetical protein
MDGSPSFVGPDRVTRLLRDLFGKAVTTKKGVAITSSTKAFTATYIDDGGTPQCVCACDVPLAASMGSALALIPPGATVEAIRKGQLPEEMFENLREVLNIMASLFEGVHVRFRDALPPSVALPKDAIAISTRPRVRVDLDLTIASYPGGKVAFMVA